MIIATDFDGTLYTDSRTISKNDFDTFCNLGKLNVTRIIATGRSIYSAFKVIPQDFPIDFLVFSSGAGIMEWKNKKVIKSHYLENSQIKTIVNILKQNNFDFMLHKEIPDNHYFYYYKSLKRITPTDDFDARCSIYSQFAAELDLAKALDMKKASQFVVIFSGISVEDHQQIYLDVKEKLKNVEGIYAIRATSPIDKKSLWIEIFNQEVSKAKAIKTVADMLSESYNNIAAVGNDFNDYDMLKFASSGYVVANSAEELKKEFVVVKSNNESGFSNAVELFLKNKE